MFSRSVDPFRFYSLASPGLSSHNAETFPADPSLTNPG